METTSNINVGTYSIGITGIGNYEGTVSKTYKIEARNITIDPKDQIGTTLDESLDQVTVTNLAPNHRLESIDFRLSNSSIIVSNPKIVDANGNDVTSNYEITYDDGLLKIRNASIEYMTPIVNPILSPFFGLIFDARIVPISILNTFIT